MIIETWQIEREMNLQPMDRLRRGQCLDTRIHLDTFLLWIKDDNAIDFYSGLSCWIIKKSQTCLRWYGKSRAYISYWRNRYCQTEIGRYIWLKMTKHPKRSSVETAITYNAENERKKIVILQKVSNKQSKYAEVDVKPPKECGQKVRRQWVISHIYGRLCNQTS